jgi:hypothetical protein
MTDHHARTQAAFRLNLEQQKKRAKELLKDVNARDVGARTRIAHATGRDPAAEFKLADAQFAIAREFGLPSWTDLKSHIDSMERARESVERKSAPPDGEMKTLHLRCGSDIKSTLQDAGFVGDFLEHSYPYCHGPVTSDANRFEREARFLSEFAGKFMNLSFDQALAARRDEEARLAASAEQYQRIVLWMEHDCFDQLVLVRCLAQYAGAKRPPVLELTDIDRFPGSIRFIGLGQLPPEAIRLLWDRRRTVSEASLRLSEQTWRALTRDDPRNLVSLMRTASPALPYLSRALRRLLQELPSLHSGLSLTQQLVLQVLSARSASINELLSALTYELDPLPFATDFMLAQTIEQMQRLSDPPCTRVTGKNIWHDTLSIAEAGRRMLAGELDLMLLSPTARWVGGVEIRSAPTWRWNEQRNEAVYR